MTDSRCVSIQIAHGTSSHKNNVTRLTARALSDGLGSVRIILGPLIVSFFISSLMRMIERDGNEQVPVH